MKFKDFFGKPIENKKTKQNILSPKKNILKKEGITFDELLNMELKLKKGKK